MRKKIRELKRWACNRIYNWVKGKASDNHLGKMSSHIDWWMEHHGGVTINICRARKNDVVIDILDKEGETIGMGIGDNIHDAFRSAINRFLAKPPFRD